MQIDLAGFPVRCEADFVAPSDLPEATVPMAFEEFETLLILWGGLFQGQVFISLRGLRQT